MLIENRNYVVYTLVNVRTRNDTHTFKITIHREGILQFTVLWKNIETGIIFNDWIFLERALTLCVSQATRSMKSAPQYLKLNCVSV